MTEWSGCEKTLNSSYQPWATFTFYVWLGTNDLTSIDKITRYISLTNQNNDTINELLTYYQLIAETLSIVPASKLTILEIRSYPIERWNSLKHHKHPENVREQNHDLWNQIDKLNNLIRYMNSSLGSHSPNFSLTLYKNPKYRKGNHWETSSKENVQHQPLQRQNPSITHSGTKLAYENLDTNTGGLLAVRRISSISISSQHRLSMLNYKH